MRCLRLRRHLRVALIFELSRRLGLAQDSISFHAPTLSFPFLYLDFPCLCTRHFQQQVDLCVVNPSIRLLQHGDLLGLPSACDTRERFGLARTHMTSRSSLSRPLWNTGRKRQHSESSGRSSTEKNCLYNDFTSSHSKTHMTVMSSMQLAPGRNYRNISRVQQRDVM